MTVSIENEGIVMSQRVRAFCYWQNFELVVLRFKRHYIIMLDMCIIAVALTCTSFACNKMPHFFSPAYFTIISILSSLHQKAPIKLVKLCWTLHFPTHMYVLPITLTSLWPQLCRSAHVLHHYSIREMWHFDNYNIYTGPDLL